MRFLNNNSSRRDFVRNLAVGAAGVTVAGSLINWTPVQAQTKHGGLIRQINYNMQNMWKTVGPGNADLLWWPKGPELGDRHVNFSFGYYTRIGDWHDKETGGHYHPDGDEVLIFVGFDPNNPEYLGAEIEFDVGKEYEKHVFRVPTACCFPKNVVHCPEITLKCEDSYGFIVLSLEPAHKTITMPQRSTLDTTEGHKYDHLYKKLVFRRDVKAKTGPGNADSLAWLRGQELENFNVNFAWGFYSGVGDWGAKPHRHSSDQFLVFVSLDNEKPYELGAEIEVTMGEEGEKHIISTPSYVIIPEGLQHGPIHTRKVERPFGFYMIRLDKGDPSEVNPA